MALKIVGVVVVVVALFLIYVSTRTSQFRYERSGLIHATPEQIYPYISDLRKGDEWSPYAEKDPAMKKTFTGDGHTVGSTYDFEGNSKVGSGRLELLGTTPNQSARIRLTMLTPFKAENEIEYRLVPEAEGTRFYWSMAGDGGFLGKLVTTLIDCEKLATGEWDKGIQKLKSLVEKQAR